MASLMRVALGLVAIGSSGVSASTCRTGAVWTEDQGADCYPYMKCCDQVPGPMKPRMTDFQSRTGNVESIITQLYSGEPHQQEFGTGDSMASSPYSVEFMTDLPTEVTLGVTLRSVTAINQKSQTIKLQYQLVFMWRDCRLVHNCQSLVNFNSNHPNFPKFWRPPYGILERIGDAGDVTSQIWISGSGTVYLAEDRESEFKCKFDFTDMPFDIQKCPLTFLIWGQNISDIKLRWYEAVTEELSNAEWNFEKDLELSEPNHVNALFEQTESALRLRLIMSRSPGFQIQVFLLPALLFYSISWVMLFVDINAVPGRVAGAIIPVLTMSGLLNSFAASLPPISYETRIKSVLLGTLVFIILHMVEFGIVHSCTRTKKAMAAKKTDDVEGADAAATKKSMKIRMIDFGADYLEVGMRALSPLCYFFMFILVLLL